MINDLLALSSSAEEDIEQKQEKWVDFYIFLSVALWKINYLIQHPMEAEERFVTFCEPNPS